MDQAETLAREICKADGFDPDEVVPEAPSIATDQSSGDAPRWRLYETQARRIIAAQTAL